MERRLDPGVRVNLWLDDMRPAPEGWILAITVDEAKLLLSTGQVERASLDHDLGACRACYEKVCPGNITPEAWLESTGYLSMPHCEHVGTGYDLVCWMEKTGHWPKEKPKVHSANPVGAARMRLAIDRYYQVNA